MGEVERREIAGVDVARVPGFGWVKKGSRATTEYCAEYSHNGTSWAMNFFAEDDDDAAKKVESIRASLSLYGRVEERIKVEA